MRAIWKGTTIAESDDIVEVGFPFQNVNQQVFVIV